MTTPLLHPTLPPSAHSDDARYHHALALAAGAVVAELFERPALRLRELCLDPQPALHFQSWPRPEALALHRPLLEETVMLGLAGDAALQIALPGYRPDRHRADTLCAALDTLRRAARDDDEAAVAGAYAEVLLARTRSMLRRHWAPVQVVAAGLLECGQLSAEEVALRLRCVNGISNRTLN